MTYSSTSTLKKIVTLVKKDLLLETRQQHAFYSILLYVACTVFVIYLCIDAPEDNVWNGLFWIVQLFVCINAVAKSFISESSGRMLYYYSVTPATHFIISKLIFNALLMMVLSVLTLLFFLLFLHNPFQYLLTFIGISFIGGLGLSLVFTFLAAIAAKAKQQAALMAIMGFPIIIPQILLLIKISNIAFSNVVQGGLWQMIGLLIGLDVLIVALAYILFPFLWRD